MHRHLLGVASLLLLVTGSILFFTQSTAAGTFEMFIGACIRVGFVLAAVWLAWPQLSRLFSRISPVALGFVLLAVALLAWRPRLIVVIGPILALAGLLHLLGFFTKPAAERGRSKRERRR